MPSVVRYDHIVGLEPDSAYPAERTLKSFSLESEARVPQKIKRIVLFIFILVLTSACGQSSAPPTAEPETAACLDLRLPTSQGGLSFLWLPVSSDDIRVSQQEKPLFTAGGEKFLVRQITPLTVSIFSETSSNSVIYSLPSGNTITLVSFSITSALGQISVAGLGFFRCGNRMFYSVSNLQIKSTASHPTPVSLSPGPD